jgi:hypothetical protein
MSEPKAKKLRRSKGATDTRMQTARHCTKPAQVGRTADRVF